MASAFKGVVIEESLRDTSVLKKLKILKTKVEPVTERHKTPWLKRWTMHTVQIPENRAAAIAEELSKALDSEKSWYADFKNRTHHYIIFKNKVFYVDRMSKAQYENATRYGVSLGIPDYQVDFSPNVLKWKRWPKKLKKTDIEWLKKALAKVDMKQVVKDIREDRDSR